MRRYLKELFLVALLTFSLAACNPATSVQTAVPPSAVATTPPPATQTPTAEPSPTPPPPQVVLLSPEGADAQLSASLAEALANLADGEGLRFESRTSLTPDELSEEVKIVLALPPAPELAGLIQAAPQTQFLAVGFPELEPMANLSLIRGGERQAERSAFLAGYLAAAITPDWRVGMVYQASSANSNTAQQAFTHGVFYFCGLCRPAYPPFPVPGYPLNAELPAGAGEADWQSAIANFQAWDVQTVYIDPEAGGEDLLRALAGAGFNLIGLELPPAGLEEQWVATVGGGGLLETLRQAWPELLAGKGGKELALPLELSHTNENLLSPGRQRLVEEMLADLNAGYIDTGTGPVEGENP